MKVVVSCFWALIGDERLCKWHSGYSQLKENRIAAASEPAAAAAAANINCLLIYREGYHRLWQGEKTTYNVLSWTFKTEYFYIGIPRAIPKSTSDWLVKKYKIEDKILLYETATYITALLHHTVAIHI